MNKGPMLVSWEFANMAVRLVPCNTARWTIHSKRPTATWTLATTLTSTEIQLHVEAKVEVFEHVELIDTNSWEKYIERFLNQPDAKLPTP
ncbi:hypothetical protein AB833_03215 [Chromatiales bacterium (ex Bugula neritina AB1)]|nr:hypothetical protein AB833_03215 [Chromatiales bacterium (ex Bugula neritina AB1)]